MKPSSWLLTLSLGALLCLPSLAQEQIQPIESGGPTIIDHYLLEYFETFPTRATRAGWRAFDDQLEDLSPSRILAWIEFNKTTESVLLRELAKDLSLDDRMDLALVLRRVRLELLDLGPLNRPAKDPLFWSNQWSGLATFQLVHGPLGHDAARNLVARIEALPRLIDQATKALGRSQAEQRSQEIWRLAASQAHSLRTFYNDKLVAAVGPQDASLKRQFEAATKASVEALGRWENFLAQAANEASGTARYQRHYEERFRIATGLDQPVADVLASALTALEAKKYELQTFGHEHWRTLMGDRPQPAKTEDQIRALFDRISEDRAQSQDEFVEHYRRLVDESIAFVTERQVVTLPQPLTLHVDRSPDHLLGASVGGVYAAGPFASSDENTLLLLPTPNPTASEQQKASFYRDFNEHFNTMITPHEVIPGHYLQLKWAARHPRKVRALFGDGVYIEGWGTFSERLMLDLGWGTPLDRIAHLKKQLENIARTIVDIQVHTKNMSREEVIDFVKDDAFQDEQFAANMWTRSLTSSPQLVTYFLGYREVQHLFEHSKALWGADFSLRRFMDTMMRIGPVPISYCKEALGALSQEPATDS